MDHLAVVAEAAAGAGVVWVRAGEGESAVLVGVVAVARVEGETGEVGTGGAVRSLL